MATNDKVTTVEHKRRLMAFGCCPVTGGLPTRMTKKSFKKLCEHWRTKGETFSQGDGRKFSLICGKCGGNKPRELKYLPVKHLKQLERMA